MADQEPPEFSPGTEKRLSRDTTVRMILAGAGLLGTVLVLLYLLAPAMH